MTQFHFPPSHRCFSFLKSDGKDNVSQRSQPLNGASKASSSLYYFNIHRLEIGWYANMDE